MTNGCDDNEGGHGSTMVATKDGGTTKGAANGCDDNEGGDGSTMEATGGVDPPAFCCSIYISISTTRAVTTKR